MSYWLDYRINKRLMKVSNVYEDRFISYLKADKPNIRNSSIEKAINAVRCFFYNAQFYVCVGCYEMVITLKESSYSKPLIYNGRKVSRKVSYEYTTKLFYWMHREGIISLFTGMAGDWKFVNRQWQPCIIEQSKVVMNEQLINDIKSVIVTKLDIPPMENVIEVRNKDGLAVAKSLDKPRQHMMCVLKRYNANSKKFTLISMGREFDIQVKKVYNYSSFDKGGRTYVIGIGAELMQKVMREELTINGERVKEIDFKSLHPRLVAEILGFTLADSFDPYGIELDGYDNSCLRAICKLLVLCMFNAKSEASAIAAVREELYSMKELDDDGVTEIKTVDYWKAKKCVPDVIELKEICRLLVEHNFYAKPYMFKGYGMDLQHLDSRIMDCVVEHFTVKDEFVLPVHDSIVIRESLLDEAISVMKIAYKQVMGSDNNCLLEVK